MKFRIMTEKEEIIHTQNRRKIPKGMYIPYSNNVINGTRGDDQHSNQSGNLFDSIANSDPDMIERYKLKSLLNSKNIVDDFNKYFIDIISNYETKIEDWQKSSYVKEEDVYKFNTNLAIMYYTDLYNLTQVLGISEKNAKDLLTQINIPQSLTEEGCRQLIKTRLSRNRLLTDSLIKMIKSNYQTFNLSFKESEKLVKILDNDASNHIGIAKIKQFMQDPSILRKFKKGNNYDFRSIGGACMFLSMNPSIQISQHPSKRLSLIFKYDAIVVGHGAGEDVSVNKAVDIHKELDTSNLSKSLSNLINHVESNALIVDNVYVMSLKIIKKTIDKKNTNLNKLNKYLKFLTYSSANFLRTKDVELFNEYSRDVQIELRKYINHIKAKKNPEQSIKDGKSQNWTVEPISTLTQNDLFSITDILRALKKEGFKNIYIGSCNPENISIPNDLAKDPDFKVTRGRASVLLEDTYEDSSIEDLLLEYDILEEYINYELLQEGKITDTLKTIAKRAFEIIKALWKKIIQFFTMIINKIKTIPSKISGNSKEKLKEPIKTGFIQFNGNNAKYIEFKCDNIEDLKTAVNKANQSINDAIKKYEQQENSAIQKLQNMIDRGEFEKKNESCGIFNNINIKFI